MDKRTPYQAVRGIALHVAWRKVRENGLRSLSLETRDAIKAFDARAFQHLRRIDRQLRKGRFRFKPQMGVAKRRPGKTPRPLVVAAIENRIVQRAILDVLQTCSPIRRIHENPSSFGGIKGRGRQEAIAAVCEAVREGARYFIRSDIEGFFTKIPRTKVLASIAGHVRDTEFLDLLKRATDTELANLDQLGDDVYLFPLGAEGVAQGSPLSTLMGNILLADFDRDMNGRRITCIRYVDDFILIGPESARVRKAFDSAQRMLEAFGMRAYDPIKEARETEMGDVTNGFHFLGCRISPGMVQPSKAARKKLLASVDETLESGRIAIMAAARHAGRRLPKKRFAQTLVDIDNILLGWGHAFSFCNNHQLLKELDRSIDLRLSKFLLLANRMAKRSSETFRRALGVHLLSDTQLIPLLPQGDKKPVGRTKTRKSYAYQNILTA